MRSGWIMGEPLRVTTVDPRRSFFVRNGRMRSSISYFSISSMTTIVPPPSLSRASQSSFTSATVLSDQPRMTMWSASTTARVPFD